jgi:hypothetical protein
MWTHFEKRHIKQTTQSNLGFNHQVMFKAGYNINVGYGQATSLYAILCHAICSNQSGRSEQSDTLSTHFVFLNTSCGERKFPEYADHDKFKNGCFQQTGWWFTSTGQL